MCLFIKSSLRVATEDIPVLKVVYSDPYSDPFPMPQSIYYTYFRRYKVPEDGILKVSDEEKYHFTDSPTFSTYFNRFGITSGAIHSYDLSMRDKIERYKVSGNYLVKIFTAVIPKGTQFFNGEDEDGWLAYASTELHVNLKTDGDENGKRVA